MRQTDLKNAGCAVSSLLYPSCGDRLLSDERILGSGDFVDRIIQEAEKTLRQQYSGRDRKKKIEAEVAAECEKEGVAVKELQAGGRRPNVSQVRKRIVKKLYESYGIPLAERLHGKREFRHRQFQRCWLRSN